MDKGRMEWPLHIGNGRDSGVGGSGHETEWSHFSVN